MRGVKRTKYKNVLFKSKFEADLAKKFDSLGIEWEYEPFSIPWQPAVRKYTPDFRLTLADGTEIILESKGFFDPSARSKMAQVRSQYPDLNIQFLFMDENKVVTKSSSRRTTYKEWAEKHGYKVCSLDTLAESNSTNVERKTGRTGKHGSARRSKGSNQRCTQEAS